MADSAKRRRVDEQVDADSNNEQSPNYQIITQTPDMSGHQTLVLNQLPVMQNQQLIYSLPQLQTINATTTNGQQQYYLFIPSADGTVSTQSLVSIPTVQVKKEVKIKNEPESELASSKNKEPKVVTIVQQNHINSELVDIKEHQADTHDQMLYTKSCKMQLYRCDYKDCSETFQSLHEKKNHLETHIFSESEEFKCSLCNMVFDKAADRNKHVTEHSVVSTYECKVCLKLFPYYTTLIKHIETKTCSKADPLKCSYCKVKFVNTNDIVKHQKFILKKCEKCNTNICGENLFLAHLKSCKGTELK